MKCCFYGIESAEEKEGDDIVSKIRGYKLALFLTIIAVLAVGCSPQKSNIGEPNPSNTIKPDASVTATGNPFEANNPNTVVLGNISHGFANPQLDKQGKMVPLQYNGGEMKINYHVAASGKAKNVGFLVFIDGKPQPYKLTTTETPYEYMHIFELQKDDQDTPLTFVFTPITGKKGDSLHVSIASVYNAAFIPDMKETASYGGYQTTLEAGRTILFNKDADVLAATSIPRQESLSNVRLSTEPVTQELLENKSGLEKVSMESLDKKVYSEISVNGAVRLDNYQIKKSGTLHVTFKLFGHPGVRYKNAFYINHKPLNNKDGNSFETVLTKGNVQVFDADIEVKDLEDFNTFYVISVPINADDFPNDVVVLDKTPSLLLYKGSE